MIKKTSKNVSFTLPPDIRLKLEAVPDIGYYDSVSEFIRDAIRTLLSEKKEIRIAIAKQLYKEGKIDIGKAVEIIGGELKDVKELIGK